MAYNITDLPFFKLFLDEVYDVLKEAGHTSCHRDVPLFVDEGEDCLLLARDSRGALGWLLASFLYPVD
jgi:dynamin-binding protein